MKMNDAFPSKYLKAEDLEEGDLVVTIKNAEFEEFTDPKTKRTESKPILHFEGKDSKPLVLNKTNYKTISQVLGSDDTDDWTGKRIALHATEVEAYGEMMLGIRVRLKAPAKAAATNAKTPARTEAQARRAALQVAPADPYAEASGDDDVPF